MVDTLPAVRTIEPWFTWGPSHAPCPLPDWRAGGACAIPLRSDSPTAELLEAPARSTPDATGEQVRKNALARLLAAARPDEIERVVQVLAHLAGQSPEGDAALLSDLGAAYYVRAELSRPQDLVRALATLDRALDIDPALAAARFNLALVLGKLQLDEQAAAAWDDYLALDARRTSGWYQEAMTRRAALGDDDTTLPWEEDKDRLLSGRAAVGEVVSRRSLACRELVEQGLLAQWADAERRGDAAEATQLLGLSRTIAAAIRDHTGDQFLADAVGAIDEAHDGDRSRFAALLEGHVQFAAGVEQHKRFRGDRGDAALAAASRLFARADSPLRLRAELYRAINLELNTELEVEQRVADARAKLDDLLDAVTDSTYGDLRGRIHWAIAWSALRAGRPLTALEHYQAARGRFSRLRDVESLAQVDVRLAELLQLMGAEERGWGHLALALGGLDSVRSEHQRQVIYGIAATSSLALDEPRAARRFHDQAFQLAVRSNEPFQIAEAHRQRAALALRAGELGEARWELDKAVEQANQLDHKDLYHETTAQILMIDAELLSTADTAQAEAALTRAIELLQRQNYQRLLAKAHADRAWLHFHNRRPDQARRDLDYAVATIDREWQGVLDGRTTGEHEELWPAYFEQLQGVFDSAIGLAVELGDPGRAFAYSERARARDLLDLLDDLPATAGMAEGIPRAALAPLTATAIAEALPANTAIVAYDVLDDSLLIWVLRADGLRYVRTPARRDSLRPFVEELHRGLYGDARYLRKPLRSLYELLIEPALDQLQGVDRLVFVPDDPLHAVPFAALQDQRRHLVQDYTVAVAPSATLYHYGLTRNRALGAKAGGAKRALVVAAHEFDQDAHPDLAPLRWAAEEGRDIAALYRESELLTGASATPAGFLDSADDYDVIHFAGHAMVNEQRPIASYLMLVGDDGALYAHQLLQRRLRSPRLVVLSSCATVGGHGIGSAGVSALVRPLIGAGIPGVVGSLWSVADDEPTHRLMTQFHRNFLTGADAAEALRAAQLSMLDDHSDDRLRVWAAFQVIGHASLEPPEPSRNNQPQRPRVARKTPLVSLVPHNW